MTGSTPQVDFRQAGRRHLVDARLLDAQDPPHLENADQLYGLAAECLLKVLLTTHLHLPTPHLHPSKGLESPFNRHIDRLWPQVMLHLQGRPGACYAGLLSEASPFRHFSVEHRYWADGVGVEQIQEHRRGAEAVAIAVDQALLFGEVRP